MLDVAVEDFQYINYPPRIPSLGYLQAEPYTNSAPIKQQQAYDFLDFRLGMESGFSAGENEGVEPDQGSTWPSYPSQQIPWNQQEEYSAVQTPKQAQHRPQQGQQQQQQQRPDLSLLYSPYDHSRSMQQSPLPIRNTSEEGQRHGSDPQSLASGPTSLDTNGVYSSPPTMTSQLSTGRPQGCLCSMLGQVCTCPSRSFTRPRLQRVDQSFNSSSSSSTGGMGDSNSSHSSLIMSPIHMHPPFTPKTNSSQMTREPPPSVSTGWLPDVTGMPVYDTSYGATSHPSYSHPVNSQLSSQMSALQYSPNDSPSTSQAQIAHPSMSYVYEPVAPPAMVTSASHHGAVGHSVSTSPSNGLGVSLAGSKADGNDAMILPGQAPSVPRSGYRSADSSLPRWSSRPSTSTSSSVAATPMSHSTSQMSMASSQGHFHPFSLNRPLSYTSTANGLTGYNGYEQQARSDALSSLSMSSSPSKPGNSQDYKVSSGSASPPVDRFSTEEERWNAIVNRTHAADAHFVYGALTTRIYCRPSCASKRPDRSRVVFYSFPDAPVKAEYAGFRACKRCKPRTPGTADVCVLAVGQCLRHITQAAMLGESEEIDSRLKKRTLKEYSSDYGVSAFHFHRTLKSVSTLTPGDYSKACHALVLQDELGMDRKDGQTLTANELQQELRGWSSRRARRAVGNILPSTYARGFPGLKMYYIYAPDTSFGKVCILYSKGEEVLFGNDNVGHPLDTDAYTNIHCTIMATLIGDDALSRVQKRSPSAVNVPTQSDWLRSLVEDLSKKGLREVQMPLEIIPWVRRARVWLAVKNAMEPRSRAAGKRTNNSEGDDEEEDEEVEDEEGSPIKRNNVV